VQGTGSVAKAVRFETGRDQDLKVRNYVHFFRPYAKTDDERESRRTRRNAQASSEARA
jgi:hypothetical protein